MNAIAFPSGDHRGTAICSPCSGPFTVTGFKMGVAWPARPWVYSFATHQLFSPGGSAATYANPFESGAQSNSYTCRLAGVACVGAIGAVAFAATKATRWISRPSSPITPEGGFIAASAPAGRVAPSTYKNAIFVPSGENAGELSYPFNCVSRRAALPSSFDTYKSF